MPSLNWSTASNLTIEILDISHQDCKIVITWKTSSFWWLIDWFDLHKREPKKSCNSISCWRSFVFLNHTVSYLCIVEHMGSPPPPPPSHMQILSWENSNKTSPKIHQSNHYSIFFTSTIFFAIFDHGEEKVLEFDKYMNLQHPTMKFTIDSSRDSVVFPYTRVWTNKHSRQRYTSHTQK